MKNKIKIGSFQGNDVELDIKRLIDTKLVIQAASGGGKSWLIRLIAERIADDVPFIILDPEGEFASLREKVDAILVGPEGEIPADLSSAALLARKLVELRVSAIIDLYELKLDKRREYVKRFLDAMIALPRSLWHPTIVIIDEAHKFCPEKGQGESVATGAVIDLMSLGRKRGYAGILATQRFSKLHNDAIAEALNVFIGLTSLDADQARAGKYLGITGTEARKLRELKPGEFNAFGPALTSQGVIRLTTDKVSTTHPKAGERHMLIAPKASDAIQQIVAHLEDLPQQAESEAKDIAELQNQVAELKAKLADASTRNPLAEDSAMITEWRSKLAQRETELLAKEEAVARESSQVEAISQSLLERETALTELQKSIDENVGWKVSLFKERFAHWTNELDELALQAGLPRVDSIPRDAQLKRLVSPMPARSVITKPPPPVRYVEKSPAPSQSQTVRENTAERMNGRSSDGTLSGIALEIVNCLAELRTFGLSSPDRRQVSFYIGKTVLVGHGKNIVGKLRMEGLLDYPEPGRLSLTDQGLARAGSFQPPTSREDFHGRVRCHLGGLQLEILDALISRYPNMISRVDLGQALGKELTVGHGKNVVGGLRTAGLVTYPESGSLRASDMLFPEGLK